ncbi:MAG: dihydrofolate reductase [Chthoniobacterales bacterium]|nr:dihydrofolate reductase [Chthoniobacterales bacterium]
MKAIAAMAENRVIGAEGKIPWHLSGELPFFKKTTLGHAIVMGRKTYESLGKPLPGRRNIVLSRTMPPTEGCTVVKNLEALRVLNIPSEEIFVIGGAEIYRLLLPECDTLILTHVHRAVAGDTFFPPFEKEFQAEKILLETPEFRIQEYRRCVKAG